MPIIMPVPLTLPSPPMGERVAEGWRGTAERAPIRIPGSSPGRVRGTAGSARCRVRVVSPMVRPAQSSAGYDAGAEPVLPGTTGLACHRARLRQLGSGRGGDDHRRPPHLAGRTTGRALSRRGAILVLGAASRLWLLLEAAARRLADRVDHGGIRRQRVCGPLVGAA